MNKMYELLAFQGPLGESENYKWDKCYGRGAGEGAQKLPRGDISFTSKEGFCLA